MPTMQHIVHNTNTSQMIASLIDLIIKSSNYACLISLPSTERPHQQLLHAMMIVSSLIYTNSYYLNCFPLACSVPQ